MADERKDAPEDVRESDGEPDAPPKSAKKQSNGKVGDEAASPPDVGENGEVGADEAELLKVLEELSDTIDTAHQALDEQHRLVKTAESEADYSLGSEPEATSVPEPPPLMSATPHKRKRGIGSVLATVAGASIGAAAIAMLWIYWQSGATDPAAERPTAKSLVKKSDAPARPMTEASNGPPELWKSDPQPELKPAEPTGKSSENKEIASIERQTPRPPARQVEPPDVPELDKGEEASILERGTRLVASGDFASARLLFEFAASRQSAAGMYALARTYDLDALAETGAVGIKPDMKLALRWYREAAGLGHKAAAPRVAEIEAAVAAGRN